MSFEPKNNIVSFNEKRAPKTKMFFVPVAEQKITPNEAKALTAALLKCYACKEMVNDVYIAALMSVFQRHTGDQGIEVIEILTSTKKFAPTRAEVIEAFSQLKLEEAEPEPLPLEIPEEFVSDWRGVIQKLKDKHGDAKVKSWFVDLAPTEINDSCLIITCPTRFVMDWVKKNFFDDLKDICSNIMDVKDVLLIKSNANPLKVVQREAVSVH